MHPIFASAGEQAVPILFVTAATFEKTIENMRTSRAMRSSGSSRE